MSDIDLDEDLLALAEGGRSPKGRSSRSTKRSKRRRSTPASDSDSDMEMDSDSDALPATRAKMDNGDSSDFSDDEEEEYPLEGKYKDEQDREDILSMTELEREAILGERSERMNEILQRSNLRAMVKAKERGQGGPVDEADRVARDRKTTGITKEKKKGLEDLKKKRAEKGEKKAKPDGDDDEEYGSKLRRRRRTPDAFNSDSSEDGEVESFEMKTRSGRKTIAVDYAGPLQLKEIVVTRAKLAEFCAAPWFAEWVKHAWVRYLIGSDAQGQPSYRLCEVIGVEERPGRTYRFENVKTNLELTLKHAKAVRNFTMEGISNSPFSDREFGRLSQTLTAEKLNMPTLKDLKAKKKMLSSHTEYIMSEADLAMSLAKKAASRGGSLAQSKAKLIFQRDVARFSGNPEQLEQAEKALAAFDAPAASPSSVDSPANSPTKGETEAERLAKVNERNRASNREEIRKAEARAQGERKKQAIALQRGDSDVKIDPSARVKTLPRLLYERDAASPSPSPIPGTPVSGTDARPAPVEATNMPRAKSTKFEQMAAAVKVDLDF